MNKSRILLALVVGAAVVPCAHADWTFSSSTMNGDYGPTKTFLDTLSVGIAASGWDVQSGDGLPTGTLPSTWQVGNATAHHLYGKWTGVPAEDGLGLTNGGDGEISKTQYIQLDMQAAMTAYNTKNFTFDFSSLQTGEGFSLWASNNATDSLANPFTLLADGFAGGTDIASASINMANYRYIEVSAYGSAAADTLVMSVMHNNPPSPTPEPVTVGLGIAGIAIAVRRRMKARA